MLSILVFLRFFVTSGGEGVFKLWDHRAEAEDSLPAGSAAASQQTERVPGEGDPTPEQGRHATLQQQNEQTISDTFSVCLMSALCPSPGLRRSLKQALPTTSWPGELCWCSQWPEEAGTPHTNRCTKRAGKTRHRTCALFWFYPTGFNWVFFRYSRWKSLRRTSEKNGATGSEWTRRKKIWGDKLKDSRVRLLI